MLRLAALLLLLANIGWFAWAQGLLAPWGLAPVQQAEPQRLSQQVQPAALRVLGPDDAKRLAESPATGPECLASAPVDDATAAGLRRLLAAWPAGSWSLEPAVDPARWIIYMGKYANAEAVERKKSELRQRAISFEPVANASLEPGLSLGGFTSQAAANEQLSALAGRGVRTARVVQERAEQRGLALRLPSVDEALRAKLADLRPALGGQPLRPCR
jgi:hypothetical protein